MVLVCVFCKGEPCSDYNRCHPIQQRQYGEWVLPWFYAVGVLRFACIVRCKMKGRRVWTPCGDQKRDIALYQIETWWLYSSRSMWWRHDRFQQWSVPYTLVPQFQGRTFRILTARESRLRFSQHHLHSIRLLVRVLLRAWLFPEQFLRLRCLQPRHRAPHSVKVRRHYDVCSKLVLPNGDTAWACLEIYQFWYIYNKCGFMCVVCFDLFFKQSNIKTQNNLNCFELH